MIAKRVIIYIAACAYIYRYSLYRRPFQAYLQVGLVNHIIHSDGSLKLLHDSMMRTTVDQKHMNQHWKQSNVVLIESHRNTDTRNKTDMESYNRVSNSATSRRRICEVSVVGHWIPHNDSRPTRETIGKKHVLPRILHKHTSVPPTTITIHQFPTPIPRCRYPTSELLATSETTDRQYCLQ